MSCVNHGNFDAEHYHSSQRDILVFDADQDDFQRVSFLQAMQHSFRFSEEYEQWVRGAQNPADNPTTTTRLVYVQATRVR